MSNTKRVDNKYFVEDHYLGTPADFTDKIINRRIDLVKNIDGFVNNKFDLVDIGCGNGVSMFLLAHKMANCVGIDIYSDHKIAFENYVKQHKLRNCEFIELDIENYDFNRTFDRLISFEVIEHLQDEKSVKFYYDILDHSGFAAITVPNKWWIFETHGAKLPILPWNRIPFFSWLPKPIHEKFANARIYTKKRIHNLLTSVGFEIIDIFYVTAPMDVLKEGKIKSFLLKYIFHNNTTRIPFLATALFVVARKN